MITSILFAVLMSLGIISSEAEYQSLSDADKQTYQEIIIDDLEGQ